MPSAQFDLLLAVKSQGAPQVASEIKGIGTASQGAATQTNQLPTSFAKVTQTSSGMMTQITKTNQVMGATVQTVSNSTKATTSWTSVLKNNVLAIASVASGVIGLVTQYTQLQKTQIQAQKAAVQEITTKNKVIDLTNKLTAVQQKYGQNSTQAAKAQRDLTAAQEKASIAAERNSVIQQSLSERTADFAVNILPNLIGVGSGVIQVLQGMRSAQQEVAAVTTITGDAVSVANAQMAISKVSAGELALANKGLAASEIATGEAATVAGSAMRTALIRTGIGALLVAAGTALIAFTQNWYGFRDAVNAAGKALGDFLPFLRPVLDFLGGTVGQGLLKLLGADIPQAAGASADALESVGAAGTKAAQEASQAAQEVASAWSNIFKSIDISGFSGSKKFKDQFRAISDLGFGKGGVHKIKFALELADTEQSFFSKISKAIGIIRTFHLPASDQKAWAKNITSDLSKAIKEEPALKNILQPLIDIIKANKTSANLGPLVASYFNSLPEDIKQVLAANQVDIPGLIKNMGFTPSALSAAVKATFQTPAFTNAIGDVSDWIMGGGGKGTTSGSAAKDTAGTAQGKSFVTNFVTSVQSQATQIGSTLDKVITNVAKGWDIIAQLAGVKDAALFSQGWQSFKEFGGQVGAWVTSALGSVNATIQGIGVGAANWFSIGWKSFNDLGNILNSWIAAAQNVTIPFITAIGQTAASNFAAGWKTFTDIGTAIYDWLKAGVDKAWQQIKAVGTSIAQQIQFGIGDFFTTNPVSKAIFGTGGPLGGPQTAGGETGITTPTTSTTPTPPGQKEMPVVDQTKYQKGLQLAINNAAQTVQLIAATLAKISSIRIPTPIETVYQKGLQLAINNAAQTVTLINTALKKVSKIVIPSPNEASKYQKGLQLAINNAAQTVKLIDKELKKVSKITIPSPDLHNFESALSQMVSDSKRAVRAVDAALKHRSSGGGGSGQGHGPGATTGPFATGGIIRSFAPGGITTTHGPQLALFGDNPGGGVETHAFIPHNDPMPTLMNLMKMFVGAGGQGQGGEGRDIIINNVTRIDGNGIINDRVFESTIRGTMGKSLNMNKFKH